MTISWWHCKNNEPGLCELDNMALYKSSIIIIMIFIYVNFQGTKNILHDVPQHPKTCQAKTRHHSEQKKYKTYVMKIQTASLNWKIFPLKCILQVINVY